MCIANGVLVRQLLYSQVTLDVIAFVFRVGFSAKAIAKFVNEKTALQVVTHMCCWYF